MVVRGYWLAGVMSTLMLGGCSGIRHPQSAAPLNMVATPSLPALTLPNISFPSLPSFPFPAYTAKENTKTGDNGLPVILPQDESKIQQGMASWYGPRFHGKRTANGEVYDQHALTAAHRTLPMGTKAMVTNIDTGESVEVRINDRGPYKYGRVIDLSYAAAQQIGMWANGTAPVRIEVLNPDGILPPEELIVPSAYAVLLASSTEAEEVASLMSRISRQQPDVYLSTLSSGMVNYYQLRLGPFRSRGAAARRAQELTRVGLQALIVAEDDRRVER